MINKWIGFWVSTVLRIDTEMKNNFGTENDSIYKEYDDLYEEYGTVNDNREAVDEENQNSDDVYEEYVTRYATYSKNDKSSGEIKGNQLPKKKWCILLIGLLFLILAIAVVLSLYFTSTLKDTYRGIILSL